MLTVQFRKYTSQAGITEDYFKVRNFFVRLGYREYTYARWDWMMTHTNLDKSAIGHIGLWEDQKEVVGVATIDGCLGQAFCMTLPTYEDLKKEMLIYSIKHLSTPEKFEVTIDDNDAHFQQIASQLGFVATPNKEFDAIFHIDQTSFDYTLPEGFSITSLKDTFDLYQYGRVLWKGFNHELDGEGEFVFNEEKRQAYENEMIRPNVDLNLKIAVVNSQGNFVSYCGMWYDPDAGFAVIEPLATDPEYRKMGLGKAAVLEGIRRCAELGAKTAFVGSSQQFYYNIKMRPYATATQWKSKQTKTHE
jgi:ribosomal protein S18 acetylase RimI-like enzyme